MQAAEVTFVKADTGHYHRVWVRRDDGTVHQLRLHVVHDLPHLAVESMLGIDDGLWASLVGTGTYPGLTAEHLVAKALTNALRPTVAEMRATLATFERPERERRASFDPVFAARVAALLDARLSSLNESVLPRAVELRGALMSRWAATSAGDKMTLRWPSGTAASACHR